MTVVDSALLTSITSSNTISRRAGSCIVVCCGRLQANKPISTHSVRRRSVSVFMVCDGDYVAIGGEALLALSSRFFNQKNFVEKHDEKAELD